MTILQCCRRFSAGSVTLYVLLSCLGTCDTVYTSVRVTPGSVWTSLPSTHIVERTPYCKFSILSSIRKVSSVDSISLNVQILLQHRQHHTHYVHDSHCICNTLLVMYVPQPITIQRAVIYPLPSEVYTASHNLPFLWVPPGISAHRFDTWLVTSA